MAEFKDSYITEEERKALLIQNLADRPNAMSSYGRAKMSAEDLKKAFDDQFILVVDRHNLLHESVEEIRGEAQTERLESLENRADTVDKRLGDQNAADSIEDVIQRVADLESLLDDPDKQDTLNESYKGVRARVKTNENNILNNAGAISENANAISENNANIAGHEGRLESLEIGMGNHNNMILTNTQKLQDIGDFLEYNQGDTDTVFLRCYPVGSIYMSVKPTDPAELFGGSWVALTDRFLVGAGGSYGVEAKGGATSHKHGSGTLGATVTMKDSSILISSIQQKDGINHKPTAKINASTRDTYTRETDYIVPVIGSTGDTTYLPPYYAVYMWRREA